jgi:alanyl-tRNA synthetase
LEQFPANQIIGKIAENIGGKGGGGKPDLAMCGGVKKDGIKFVKK